MEQNPLLLNDVGSALSTCGEYAAARECFLEAIKLAPDNKDIQFNYALMLKKIGEIVEAEKILAGICETEANGSFGKKASADAFDVWGLVLIDLDRKEDARKAFENALAIDDSVSRIWNNLGTLNFIEGDRKEAVRCFERALTLNPYNADALYNLRDSYNETDNIRGALLCAIFDAKRGGQNSQLALLRPNRE